MGVWRPISQYMLCTSIQWLMEVQGRTVQSQVSSLMEQAERELNEAAKWDEQAAQLEEQGKSAEAQDWRLQAEQARSRAGNLKAQAAPLGGPWQRVTVDKRSWWHAERVLTKYYNLIFIPVFALCIAVWIAAANVPNELRRTNQIVKIGAVVGLFHGGILGFLVILWWWFGSQSLSTFYSDGRFYHGQWTGLWLFPVAGVLLTGYLFGTLAGWLAKRVEQLRCTVVRGLRGRPSKSA